MKKALLPSAALPALCAACILCTGAACLALEPAGWQYRQAFDIGRGGPARIPLPAGTLDGAQPDLRDLRVLAPDGAELPYALPRLPAAREAGETTRTLHRAAALQVNRAEKEIVVTIETGTDERLDSVEPLIPDTSDYLLPARVEISGDGRAWETLADRLALFRRGQGGRHGAVVQNTLPLGRRTAAWVRVAIAFETGPVAVAGARLRTVTATAARAAVPDEEVAARIVATSRRAGETLLAIDLGAANLALSELAFDIADPLFMRGVTITAGGENGGAGENAAAASGETVLARGALYRVAVGDRLDAHKTALDLGGVPAPARRIVARIEDGDSPPLDVRGVTAKRRPVHLVFNPPAAGRHVFLSGNPRAAAPRYDLAALADRFADLPVTAIAAGPVEAAPGYRPPAEPDEPWRFARSAGFWVALALVVAVLLFVIGRLLPKAETDAGDR
ncbi:MAG: DUF3999 domain-containing protein [Opitutaceae bacterium]|jgi:hypothetical protein|nr:DUF3999 domain-containing protein [Opitutaceae bacterium]